MSAFDMIYVFNFTHFVVAVCDVTGAPTLLRTTAVVINVEARNRTLSELLGRKALSGFRLCSKAVAKTRRYCVAFAMAFSMRHRTMGNIHLSDFVLGNAIVRTPLTRKTKLGLNCARI